MFISASGRVSQRSLKRVKEKEEIGAEDQSDKTEASNLLSETCFGLESHGSVVELHVAGQLVNTDDNTGEVDEVNVSQEEGNLNSLWYDDKNAQ